MNRKAESYLKPEVIQTVGRLDLRARFIIEGFLSGLHASPFHGFSVEFSEHRRYSQGNDPKDIDWLVAHQANKRIIDATANRIELDESKVMMNIHKYGNTTSATLPLLLNDYESQLKKGDTLIFAAFGGGFTWGSIYLKWAYNN